MTTPSQRGPRHSLSLLSLLLFVAAAASAQSTAPTSSDSAVADAPVQASSQAVDSPSVKPAPKKVVVNTGTPVGTGKWVPRIDKKTCPKGSEPYLDETDGGVKCWVNTQ